MQKRINLPEFKAEFCNLEAEIYGIAYNNLVFGKKNAIFSDIKRKIRTFCIKFGLDRLKMAYIYNTSVNFVRILRRQVDISLKKQKKTYKNDADYKKYVQICSEIVYSGINKGFPEAASLKKCGSSLANSIDFDQKKADLETKLNENTGKYTPFWLCSCYSGCESEHKNYQGRMYVDAKWRQNISDPDVLQRVQAYIVNHKCLTVQEITGSPVYLVTRPNCRHTLKRIPIGEVLTSSINSLLRKYLLIQTSHTVLTYEMKMVRVYKERLYMRRKLWQLIPNPELAHDMSEDRKLIAKWTKLAYRANSSARH